MKIHKVQDRWVRMESGQEQVRGENVEGEEEEEGRDAPGPQVPHTSEQQLSPSMTGFETPPRPHSPPQSINQDIEACLGKFTEQIKGMIDEFKDQVLKSQEELRELVYTQLQMIRGDILRMILRIESLETVIDHHTQQRMNIKVDLSGLQKTLDKNLEDQRVTSEGQFDSISQQITGLSERLGVIEKLNLNIPDINVISEQLKKMSNEICEGILLQKGGTEFLMAAAYRLDTKIDTLQNSFASSRPTSSSAQPQMPNRPPFSSTIRSGTGFSQNRPGPFARTRSRQTPSSSSVKEEPIINLPSDDESA